MDPPPLLFKLRIKKKMLRPTLHVKNILDTANCKLQKPASAYNILLHQVKRRKSEDNDSQGHSSHSLKEWRQTSNFVCEGY